MVDEHNSNENQKDQNTSLNAGVSYETPSDLKVLAEAKALYLYEGKYTFFQRQRTTELIYS